MAIQKSKTGINLWFERLLAAGLLGGQVIVHLLKSKINRRNTLEQMVLVGPES
ncbi:MAG: ABC transporter permease, partial [Okeania sp. SIO2D1]|nr:ABC transporter permease [Okeania sp. SIO2D1]